MKRKRFSEERIIGILKENGAGAKVDDLCRRHGISTTTFYAWRARSTRPYLGSGWSGSWIGWSTLRGKPSSIVLDNGPEFVGGARDRWAYRHGVRLSFIPPGRPLKNAFVESFNGRLRDPKLQRSRTCRLVECLNLHWFMSLAEARRVIEEWRLDYNQQIRRIPSLAAHPKRPISQFGIPDTSRVRKVGLFGSELSSSNVGWT